VASFRKPFKILHIEPFVSLTFLAQIATKFTKRALLFYKYFLNCLRDSKRRMFLEGQYNRQQRFLMEYLQHGGIKGEFEPLAEIEVIIKMIPSYLKRFCFI
jgi:hypothetical protein